MTKRIIQAVAGGMIFLFGGESFAAPDSMAAFYSNLNKLRRRERTTAYYTEYIGKACEQAFTVQNEMDLKAMEGHYTIQMEEHTNSLRDVIKKWQAAKRTVEQKKARVEGLVAKLAAETAKAGDAWRNTPDEQSLEGAVIGLTGKIIQLYKINEKLDSLSRVFESGKEKGFIKNKDWVELMQSEKDRLTAKATPFGKMEDLENERTRLAQELENKRFQRGAPYAPVIRSLQRDLDQATDELGKAMSDAVWEQKIVRLIITSFEVNTLATNWILQCVDYRREALTLAMPPADLQASVAACVTDEGPFGCTGQFSGSYQITCSGGGTSQQDQGGGTVNFRADGWMDLRFKSAIYPDSNPNPLSGEIDAQGRVRIDRIDRDTGIAESWLGHFSLVPAADGKQRPAGGGTYDIKVTDGQGNLEFSCQGTFQLTEGGAL